MKAKALINTRHIQLDAFPFPWQWWEKTESGKRWELWTHDGEGGKMIRRLTYINSKNVLWVIPAEEPEEENLSAQL